MENDSHDLVCASYWETGLAGGKAIFSPKWDGQVGDVGYCSLQLPVHVILRLLNVCSWVCELNT